MSDSTKSARIMFGELKQCRQELNSHLCSKKRISHKKYQKDIRSTFRPAVECVIKDVSLFAILSAAASLLYALAAKAFWPYAFLLAPGSGLLPDTTFTILAEHGEGIVAIGAFITLFTTTFVGVVLRPYAEAKYDSRLMGSEKNSECGTMWPRIAIGLSILSTFLLSLFLKLSSQNIMACVLAGVLFMGIGTYHCWTLRPKPFTIFLCLPLPLLIFVLTLCIPDLTLPLSTKIVFDICAATTVISLLYHTGWLASIGGFLITRKWGKSVKRKTQKGASNSQRPEKAFAKWLIRDCLLIISIAFLCLLLLLILPCFWATIAIALFLAVP